MNAVALRELVASARVTLGKVEGYFDADSAESLVHRLTLLLLAFQSGGEWYLRVPMVLVCIAGLAIPAMPRSARFWLVISALFFFGHLPNWYSIDNHKYLMGYWCLTILLAFSAKDGREHLRKSARGLIALAFLLAFGWKAATPNYTSGAFFEYQLITDGRFESVARLVAGFDSSTIAQNRASRRATLGDEPEDQTVMTARFSVPTRTRAAALFLTRWTLAIELTIGLLFLLPHRWRAARYRDGALCLFIVTTYSVATVVGFGWTLVVMGVAQAGVRARIMYVASFLLVQAYTLPWFYILN